MVTLEQIKQTSNFYTITVTINTDNMQYSRSRVTTSPETDKTALLLVYGDENDYPWSNYDIYETLQMIAKDVLTDDELENNEPFALLLPDFDLNDIYDELDQYKPFVSVENKNLVYSLNKL